MALDKETLESLLDMEEGPSLDFKRKQYRFNKASDKDKSELLKDILAFANSQRYRTAYILAHISHINLAGLAVISNRTTRCSRIAEYSGYHEC